MGILLDDTGRVREVDLLAIVNKAQLVVPLDQLGTHIQHIDNTLGPLHVLPGMGQGRLDQLAADTAGLLGWVDREETKEDLLVLGDRFGVGGGIAFLLVLAEIGIVLGGLELDGTQGLVGLGVKGQEDGVDRVEQCLLQLIHRNTLLRHY